MPMRSVKAADYMSRKLITFSPDTNVVEAMRTLLTHKISGAPVVDEEGVLVGVLSEVDLMKVIVQDSYYGESVGIVADYMHSPVESVSHDLDIYDLAERFLKTGRRRYPVVRDGKLVGQISRRDVLRAAEALIGSHEAIA
ncbi:MAG: CBS domain-containing protein [Pseudomonadota bacterium]